MTGQQDTDGGNGGSAPIACTLTRPGLAARAGRWARLVARAMTGRAEVGGGLRLAFRPGPGVEEELRELAAAENECCSWAAWTVEAGAGKLVLDVRSPGDGAAVLHGMFTGPPPSGQPAGGAPSGRPGGAA